MLVNDEKLFMLSSFPFLLVTQTQETAFDVFHCFFSCVHVSQENDQGAPECSVKRAAYDIIKGHHLKTDQEAEL